MVHGERKGRREVVESPERIQTIYYSGAMEGLWEEQGEQWVGVLEEGQARSGRGGQGQADACWNE